MLDKNIDESVWSAAASVLRGENEYSSTRLVQGGDGDARLWVDKGDGEIGYGLMIYDVVEEEEREEARELVENYLDVEYVDQNPRTMTFEGVVESLDDVAHLEKAYREVREL